MYCCSKKDLDVHAIVVALAVAADAAVVCAVEQTKTKNRVGVFVTALSELAEPGAGSSSIWMSFLQASIIHSRFYTTMPQVRAAVSF